MGVYRGYIGFLGVVWSYIGLYRGYIRFHLMLCKQSCNHHHGGASRSGASSCSTGLQQVVQHVPSVKSIQKVLEADVPQQSRAALRGQCLQQQNQDLSRLGL